MNFPLGFWRVGIALVVISSVVWAEADFTRPQKALGFSDFEGKLIMWTGLAPLKLSDGTTLPVVLRFSTAESGAKSLLGRHWWMPLMESTAVPKSETLIFFTTLGGRLVPMQKAKDGTFTSQEGRYKGVFQSATEFVVTADEWEFRFVNGRLRSAKGESGVQLEWTTANGRSDSIVEKGRGSVLRFQFDAKTGIPSELIVNDTRYSLQSQQIPLVSVTLGQPLITGYAASVSSIDGDDISDQFPIQFNPNGVFTMDYRSTSWPARRYEWSGANERIISDGEWTYYPKDRPSGPPALSRVDKGGRTESYFYDPKTGISTYVQPDGTETTRYFFIGNGPVYHKVRKQVDVHNGVTSETRWSYDEFGREIRMQVGEYSENRTYFPSGVCQVYEKVIGNKVQYRLTSDEQGRPLSKQRGQTIYEYSYNPTGTVVKQVIGGKVTGVKVNDLTKDVAVFFPARQTKESPFNFETGFSANASPEQVDQARVLAMKALGSLQHEENR